MILKCKNAGVIWDGNIRSGGTGLTRGQIYRTDGIPVMHSSNAICFDIEGLGMKRVERFEILQEHDMPDIVTRYEARKLISKLQTLLNL